MTSSGRSTPWHRRGQPLQAPRPDPASRPPPPGRVESLATARSATVPGGRAETHRTPGTGIARAVRHPKLAARRSSARPTTPRAGAPLTGLSIAAAPGRAVATTARRGTGRPLPTCTSARCAPARAAERPAGPRLAQRVGAGAPGPRSAPSPSADHATGKIGQRHARGVRHPHGDRPGQRRPDAARRRLAREGDPGVLRHRIGVRRERGGDRGVARRRRASRAGARDARPASTRAARCRRRRRCRSPARRAAPSVATRRTGDAGQRPAAARDDLGPQGHGETVARRRVLGVAGQHA